MSFRTLSIGFRHLSRRLSTASERSGQSSNGSRLPVGNDPSAFHPVEHADTIRWRTISAVFAVPVTGFLILELMKPHEHHEPPPDYPFLKMATRDDLIGTSYERHAKEHGDGHDH